MLAQLSSAGGLIPATVAIQAPFMSIGPRAFKALESQRPGLLARGPTLVTVICVLFLIIPVILDVTLWAMVYRYEALPDLQDALYFSTVTFTTVGCRARVASAGDL